MPLGKQSNTELHWSGGPGFNPHSEHPLTAGWVAVSVMLLAKTEVMGSPLCLCVTAGEIVTVRRQSWDPFTR